MDGKDGLVATIKKNSHNVSFHTPAHNNKLGQSLLTCDVTELPQYDNLLSPTTVLKELENGIASAYNAEACFISTQGATHSIFSAVYATKECGAFLIIGKVHVSVYNAMRIFNCAAYHVDGVQDIEIPSEVKTVILTSPDYFGHCLDLKTICAEFHKKGLAVIVDAAHGSHFMFCDKLPDSATEYADLVIHSVHKTLPVITGGSLLLTKKEYAEKCLLCRKLLHTTSPNYMTMCSIENAVFDFRKNGQKYYESVLEYVRAFRDGVKNGFYVEKNDDPTRLVLVGDYDGREVYDELAKLGFDAEMSAENKVVFIVTPYNAEYLPELMKAVNGLWGLTPYKKVAVCIKAHPTPTPIAFGGDCEVVPLSCAEGRRAFLEIGFYPPGVPLIYSHEEITAEQIKIISQQKNVLDVFGLDNGSVYVLK